MMVVLANHLTADGYEVDLVLVKAEGPYLNKLSNRVRVIDLNASRVATSIPALIRYIRNERPVSMLSAMGHVNVGAVIAGVLSSNDHRMVISERANITASGRSSIGLKVKLWSVVCKWAYDRADAIVAISNGVAADVSLRTGVPFDSINVVYNPAFNEKFNSKPEPSLAWSREKNLPTIIGAGRLVPQKDFSCLIHAFNSVRHKLEARLIILGEGPLRAELEGLVRHLGLEGDVLLPGFVESPEVYMQGASVFVLSSAWEGFGNVIVEAMACGLPVVSTDCPSGPAEILENGKWGRLVPVANSDAMAEAIVRTLQEQRHPNVLQRAAYFSVESAVEGYLQAMLPHVKRGTADG